MLILSHNDGGVDRPAPRQPGPRTFRGMGIVSLDPQRIAELSDLYRHTLLEDTIPFWERHGVDRECGGFFAYLERDGAVYGTDKPVWLIGRATWLFATLYHQVEPRPEWLALAWHGHEFLHRHCFDEHGKMYFSVTREGRPLRMRRYVYSEVFSVMAFAALARATQDDRVRQQAIDLFQSFIRQARRPGRVEPKVDPHTRPMKSLSPLMCLLCIADIMRDIDDDPRYEHIIDEVIAEILGDFVKSETRMVLEIVAPTGEPIDGPEGRMLKPGHAIEAAWFIMEVARRRGDQELIAQAAGILDWSFDRGWDQEYGGLLYCVDAAGKPPAMLEHDMKLWWPHCETLYSALLALHLTGQRRFAEIYELTHEWTFAHFPDALHGEWYGYLRRDGAVSSTLKGNLWKGAFHIPGRNCFAGSCSARCCPRNALDPHRHGEPTNRTGGKRRRPAHFM